MKYFIVAFQNIEIQEETNLRDTFGENGFKFWHRFPTVWIVVTPDDMDASGLRDMIFDVLGDRMYVIVTEFNAAEISVVLPPSYQEWFKKHLNFSFQTVDDPEEKK
jgi:hypothetical protein